MDKKIIYGGRTFSLGTTERYYFTHKQGKSISLHRYKYEREVGPIPDGWHVHHKDGNCFNNDVENLQAIDPKEHSKLHVTSVEVTTKWQQAGIKVAPEWHKSEEGKEWHRNNYYENAKDYLHKKYSRNCSNCDKEIETKRKNGSAFCTNACKSAWRRKNKPDMKIKPCETCGKEYETRKYLPTRFCSKECKPAPNPFGSRGKNKVLVS